MVKEQKHHRPIKENENCGARLEMRQPIRQSTQKNSIGGSFSSLLEALDGQRKRVLLVDDDYFGLIATKCMLEQYGLDSDLANDGVDAVEKVS